MTAPAAELIDNELMAAAVRYRKEGRPIFPVCWTEPHQHRVAGHLVDCEEKNRGKTPLVPWKDFQSRVPTEREVHRWWRHWPLANIGMATGRLSGIVVGDLDGELAQAKATQYGYETGPYVLTGRPGGLHLFFAWRDDAPHNFAKKEGIDYRGDGGYVVLPPSRHILGTQYRWGAPITDVTALPPLPEWFDLLAGNVERGNYDRYANVVDEAIPEHERNTTLVSLGGSMRRRGMSETEILAALGAVNQERCHPPLSDDEVAKIANSVARYAPEEVPSRQQRRQQARVDLSKVEIVDVSDIQPEDLSWAWDKRLALGTFALIQGDPGLGKSLILTDVAARISTGRALPGEPPETVHEPRNIVMLVNEDDLARTIRPRLDRASADIRRIAIIKGQYDEEGVLMPLDLSHKEQLRHAFEVKKAVMLIIDPLFGHLPAGLSISKEEEIRHLLAPLVAIVSELEAVIVGVRHLNQAVELPSQYRGMGAGAWRALSRSELSVMKDPFNNDGKDHYVLARSKGNLGKVPTVLTYTIESEGDDDIPYIVWGEPHSMTWDEIVYEAATARKSDSAVGKAQVAVLKAIADAGGLGITWAEVVEIVAHDGHTAHTAERARKELSLEIVNRKARNEEGVMQTRWFTLEHFTSSRETETSPKSGNSMAVSFVGVVGEVGVVVDPEKVVSNSADTDNLANLPKKTHPLRAGEVGETKNGRPKPEPPAWDGRLRV